MNREKAKTIIESHGIGYTIEEWNEAMSVIFEGFEAGYNTAKEVINELSDIMSYDKDCEELINDFWDKIEELKNIYRKE